MGALLDDALHARIAALCKRGDDLVNRGEYEAALTHYEEAWDLLPEPKHDWDAATLIKAAMGDACWFRGEWHRAAEVFSEALRCPGGLGNPFVHLRLGEAHYELGNRARAADELTRAYMGAGREIFASEDPKYLDLLRDKLIPPEGQDLL